MDELSVLLTFAVGLAGALIFGYVAIRFKLSPIIGYLLSGILAKSFAESPAACRGDECMPFTGGYKGERSVPLIRIGPCVTI